jgi:hypothetical protein
MAAVSGATRAGSDRVTAMVEEVRQGTTMPVMVVSLCAHAKSTVTAAVTAADRSSSLSAGLDQRQGSRT